MEESLKREALRFVDALRENRAINGFLEAKNDFDADGELIALKAEYAALMGEFQGKQVDGKVTREDIARLRALQMKVSTHPVTTRFLSARNEAVAVLKDCNAIMSHLLGINFAATAAPAGSCCG